MPLNVTVKSLPAITGDGVAEMVSAPGVGVGVGVAAAVTVNGLLVATLTFALFRYSFTLYEPGVAESGTVRGTVPLAIPPVYRHAK
jgi:hypothetical protein